MRYIVLFFIFATSAFAGNSVYIDQIGSNNDTTVTQLGSTDKTAIILNKGDSNTINITQEDIGNHTAFIGTPPTQAPSNQNNQSYVYPTNNNNSNNNLSIVQIGSGNHSAAINLDPTTPTSNNTATILQGGAANKSFNLSLSGSSITANIIQDSATVPDAASMSIQCLTPPCNGYSYSKR
jgi:hypothetical protein